MPVGVIAFDFELAGFFLLIRVSADENCGVAPWAKIVTALRTPRFVE